MRYTLGWLISLPVPPRATMAKATKSDRDGSTAEADAKVAAIATAARRSRALHRKQHVVAPADAANELLADRILEALASGARQSVSQSLPHS